MAFVDREASLLPWERWQRSWNFGRSLWRPAWVIRPTREEEIAEILQWAAARGWTVALRGSGRSYGDAALTEGHILLDLSRMNRILAWDPERGRLTVEPGVTVAQIWRYTLEDGWWPPVVPGTMHPTVGGMLAVNVHGKNNWQAGTLGEHVRSLRLLLPTGDVVTLRARRDDEALRAVIGGLGVLGVITRVTLQLKRVYSGDVEVRAWAAGNLRQVLEDIDVAKDAYEYVVAWVDGLASGRALGRGQIHVARHLEPGEDPVPARTLRVAHQELPDTLFGVFPKRMMWWLMRPWMHNPGVRFVNLGKYLAARTLAHKKVYRQSLVAFNFLLDYIPGWERAYGRGGLIQFQVFVPKARALDVFTEMLRYSQRTQPSYLVVIKRHRPDAFLLSHAVDGFSMAMDFPVRAGNTKVLGRMLTYFHRLVLDAGGRFYFAKDASLTPEVARAFLGDEALRKFFRLKAQWDPQHVLQSALYRRVLLPLREEILGGGGSG